MKLWFWRRETSEAELEEEVRTHMDMATQARVERGVNQKEAERSARLEFGNVELVKETARDHWGRRWVEELAQDLRFGMRSFFRNPGFTTVAVLTLALGVGANTVIFSAVNSVLLQPLPFRDPDRLVRVFSSRGTPAYLPVSGEDYFDWESQNHSFEGISLYSAPQNFNASGAGEPETVSIVSAQANFLVIGVAPRFGREFAEGEDRPGNGHVALRPISQLELCDSGVFPGLWNSISCRPEFYAARNGSRGGHGHKVYDDWESGGKVLTATQPQWSTSAIINRAMAQAFWPNQEAVGKVSLNAIV